MLIIDGHEDLAWNAMMLGRDISLPLAEIRAAEGPEPAHGEGTATVSLPSLRAAGVRVVMATVFATPRGSSLIRQHGYATPDEAYHQARVQMEYYRHLEDRGEVTILRTARDLAAVLAGERPLPALLLVMEGADPIRTPDDLAQFADWGLRAVGLAWHATRYAGGTGEPGPLTAAGPGLLREMERLGLALDISHLAEAAFWEALDLFSGPVFASHANVRALVPTDRQLSDAMIKALAARDGVIGLVFYNRFIQPNWTTSDGKDAVTFDDLLHHANYIRTLAGPRHFALGTDLDGGVGREITPREIDSVEDLPRFADALRLAGYPSDDVDGIMGGNWLRMIERLLI